MLLTELFKQPVPYEWTTKTPTEWIAEFSMGERVYEITFNKVSRVDLMNFRDEFDFGDPYYNPLTNLWQVAFSLFDRTKVGLLNQFELTKTGNASFVLATVIAAMQEFKQSRPTAILFFTAKEPSRISLYGALTKRFNGKRVLPIDGDLGEMGFIIR